jgi:hypothetical protein
MTPEQRRNAPRQRFIGSGPLLTTPSDQPGGGLEPAITDIPATDFTSRYVGHYR